MSDSRRRRPSTRPERILLAGGSRTRFLLLGAPGVVAAVGGYLLHSLFQPKVEGCNYLNRLDFFGTRRAGNTTQCKLDRVAHTAGSYIEWIGIGLVAVMLVLLLIGLIVMPRRALRMLAGDEAPPRARRRPAGGPSTRRIPARTPAPRPGARRTSVGALPPLSEPPRPGARRLSRGPIAAPPAAAPPSEAAPPSAAALPPAAPPERPESPLGGNPQPVPGAVTAGLPADVAARVRAPARSTRPTNQFGGPGGMRRSAMARPLPAARPEPVPPAEPAVAAPRIVEPPVAGSATPSGGVVPQPPIDPAALPPEVASMIRWPGQPAPTAAAPDAVPAPVSAQSGPGNEDPGPAEPASERPNAPLAELKRLAQRHASGELSDAQHQAARDRLIRQVLGQN